jgi:hypothetical protein
MLALVSKRQVTRRGCWVHDIIEAFEEPAQSALPLTQDLYRQKHSERPARYYRALSPSRCSAELWVDWYRYRQEQRILESTHSH